MNKNKKSVRVNQAGFTLIELLVIIAIIGILASIILASLASARQKSRDARRLADINQLQKALVLHYDSNSQQYADTLTTIGTTYIPSIPSDPLGPSAPQYQYAGLTDGTGTQCETYHLGATLEQSSNPALAQDANATVSVNPVCGASAADFDGTVATVYDVVP